MRFIGDAHGKWENLKILQNQVPASIQVGDMGIGFREIRPPTGFSFERGNHRFIRGNHDNPGLCRKTPGYIFSGTIETMDNIGKVMFVGGASSIDAHMRTEGVSWWRDEELSIARCHEMLDIAEREKPDVIVSHECPQFVVPEMFFAVSEQSRTRQMFDTLFEIVEPRWWIFGHWHRQAAKQIDGCTFVCLDELGVLDL